jgi:hypothetical protein
VFEFFDSLVRHEEDRPVRLERILLLSVLLTAVVSPVRGESGQERVTPEFRQPDYGQHIWTQEQAATQAMSQTVFAAVVTMVGDPEYQACWPGRSHPYEFTQSCRVERLLKWLSAQEPGPQQICLLHRKELESTKGNFRLFYWLKQKSSPLVPGERIIVLVNWVKAPAVVAFLTYSEPLESYIEVLGKGSLPLDSTWREIDLKSGPTQERAKPPGE